MNVNENQFSGLRASIKSKFFSFLIGTVFSLTVAVFHAHAQSPSTIGGRTIQLTVANSKFPFASSGIFRFLPSVIDTVYAIVPISGNTEASTGTYAYSKNGGNTARLSLVDSGVGGLTVNCTFSTPNSGTYTITSTAYSGASQTGTFVVYSGASPTMIAGTTATVDITSGEFPFASWGSFQFLPMASGTYNVIALWGNTLGSSGTYSYSKNSAYTGVVNFDDIIIGHGLTYQLSFDTPTTGTLFLRKPGSIGYQTGVFSMTIPDVPPSISITAPTFGQRWSNSVFTVTGRASDDAQVAAVYYQLNGRGWNLASTANGWLDWSGIINLSIPGTNIVQAYAVDFSGKSSSISSQTIVYVITFPVSVQTSGNGTVSPNYNGQMLEIGKSYSMTATATTGFAFTNWTGSVPTNGATVKFIMAAGLVLTANFADIQKPTISITNAAKIYTNAQIVTVSATASDNVGITFVEFYDGAMLKGSDTASIFTYEWPFTAADNGAHVWTARAYDAAGNSRTSSPVTLTVSIDITPPTVVISSPTNGANLTTSSITVSGTASDLGSPSSGVASVQVRVNGGNWTNATGTATWTRSAALKPCENIIEARSLDKAGNYSLVASKFVIYTAPNAIPQTPANVSPSSGETVGSLTPVLQASPFSDYDCVGDTHAASQWQVLNSAGAVVVADSGTNSANLTSWTVPAIKLYYGSNYQWRVRYRDSRNGWSSNSAPTTFKTSGPLLVGTPLNTNILLKWPTNALGFVLQWSTTLGVASWSNAAPPAVIVSGQYTVTNSMTNDTRFYRLRK